MTCRPALVLAAVATSTTVCMSVLAGWQRGGWMTERLVWVAIGVVLVACAHLLPVLCRPAPVPVRCAGTVLWLACMATACYGHATFFLLAQQHAGGLRVASVVAPPILPHRSLTIVMDERANVVGRLATLRSRRCVRDCTLLDGRRAALTAHLDALDAEAAEVRRAQVEANRVIGQRDLAMTDPVTSRLATVTDITAPHLELVAGLGFALVLECLACLLWWIALWPHGQRATVTNDHDVSVEVVVDRPESLATVTEPETEVTKLARDIEAGLARPTVADIRRHLRCSQAKAAVLRRQLVQSKP
ncbi:hypothetical protein SAMN02787142_3031 [Burkholderia sp. WP9]|uniref:hypothetical protein n=1 Tax=Burkholderia sp. WP9 TaxID=1500263 RepID=UPI00089AC7C1|nr:hypothetical protein [Burkholderia sp. WP9]SED35779.1 hypothetical protein SAMN02787142_3031 [Burkholderia sp. WP9]